MQWLIDAAALPGLLRHAASRSQAHVALTVLMKLGTAAAAAWTPEKVTKAAAVLPMEPCLASGALLLWMAMVKPAVR